MVCVVCSAFSVSHKLPPAPFVGVQIPLLSKSSVTFPIALASLSIALRVEREKEIKCCTKSRERIILTPFAEDLLATFLLLLPRSVFLLRCSKSWARRDNAAGFFLFALNFGQVALPGSLDKMATQEEKGSLDAAENKVRDRREARRRRIQANASERLARLSGIKRVEADDQGADSTSSPSPATRSEVSDEAVQSSACHEDQAEREPSVSTRIDTERQPTDLVKEDIAEEEDQNTSNTDVSNLMCVLASYYTAVVSSAYLIWSDTKKKQTQISNHISGNELRKFFKKFSRAFFFGLLFLF